MMKVKKKFQIKQMMKYGLIKKNRVNFPGMKMKKKKTILKKH